MQFAIEIERPVWQPVITISQGNVLTKGRRNDWYRTITAAAGEVSALCGCYCWCNTDTVFYVGSFRPYARKGYKSSLHARVHNYLQNHRIKDTGQINTNLMVFDNLNRALQQSDVIFAHFTFEKVRVGDEVISFDTFSADATLVHAVEELLICTYRRTGQCAWNRT